MEGKDGTVVSSSNVDLDSESGSGSGSLDEVLLRLVGEASCIVAELRKSSSSIPGVFSNCLTSENASASKGKNASAGAKYRRLLFDFAYLKDPEDCERRLREGNASTTNAETTQQEGEADSTSQEELPNLEAEFAATYGDGLVGLYKMFESVYLYQLKLHSSVKDLLDGMFIPHTLDSLLLQDAAWSADSAMGLGYGQGSIRSEKDSSASSLPASISSSAHAGRQLLCEAIYLYGIMLLLMERYYPGPIRERIIVAFIRYKLHRWGTPQSANPTDTDEEAYQQTSTHLDGVCRLCRATSDPSLQPSKPDSTIHTLTKMLWKSSDNSKQQTNQNITLYSTGKQKEKLFARFPFPADLITNAIGRLIADDLYLMSPVFPNLNHRSTRLARQASMVYVLLYFHPPTLDHETATMREIIDKFFGDNWVLALPNSGLVVDLQREWSDFEAAKTALDNNVLQLDHVLKLHRANASLVRQCLKDLKSHLCMEDAAAGAGAGAGGGGGAPMMAHVSPPLTHAYVLDHSDELLHLVRTSNVALRWRLLHRRTTDEEFGRILRATATITTTTNEAQGMTKAKDEIVSDADIVALMLHLAHLEGQLETSFHHLVQSNHDTWKSSRESARKRTKDISNYYKGEQSHALAHVTRDDTLVAWFDSMSTRIDGLAYGGSEHVTVTGRKIQQILKALEDVERFDAVDSDVQVKASLVEVRAVLLQMVRVIRVPQDVQRVLQCVMDMSYCWSVIGDYVGAINLAVRKDPSKSLMLYSLFLKMESTVEENIVRMKQCREISDEQVAYIGGYFSSELLAFIRRVMGIIPSSIFVIMKKLIEIYQLRLRTLPLTMQVDDIRDYNQEDERYVLSKLKHELSVYARAIAAMKENGMKTTENFYPRRSIEEGIRRGIVMHMSEALHTTLQFRACTAADLTTFVDCRNASMATFETLARKMDAYRCSIQQVHDYVGICSMQLWFEEYHRIIAFYVLQEARKYMRKKVPDVPNAALPSKGAPIPTFPSTPTDPACLNFMGRLVSVILRMTDAQTTVYSREYSGWFLEDGTELCGLRFFSVLGDAVGVSGLSGLQQLLSYRILHELHRFLAFYRTTVKVSALLLEQIRDDLFPEWKNRSKPNVFYPAAVQKMEKITVPLLTCLRRIGQAQLVRKTIQGELKTRSKIEAATLHDVSTTLESALMYEIQSNENFTTIEQTAVINQLKSLLQTNGTGDPIATVFLPMDPLEGLPVLLLLFVLSIAPKLKWDSDFGTLVRARDSFPLDGLPVVAGTVTLLRQFHPSYTKSLLAYLGQYVRSTVADFRAPENPRKHVKLEIMPKSAKNAMLFAMQMCSFGGLQKSELFRHVPEYLVEVDLCAD